MLAQFDPTVYKKHNSYIAGLASAAFCALVGYLAYLWGSLEIGWDRYQGYFKGVDAVMEACPTPYTRLNKDDQIIAANQAFRTLFGLTELTTHDKLKEFCADEESREQYDRVENDRKKRRPVTPYELTLRSRDGSTRRVIVHSAAAPSEIRNSLPDTFGIMLDANVTQS
jgi:PAS domain S-box-containing protein